MSDAIVEPVAAVDPGAALQAAFAAIHETRMRGLPFVNEALQVEAAGFRRWNGYWLGALVTPWFINLMLLPDQPEVWRRRRIGEKEAFAFPAGRFDFIAGKEPSFGEYLACSLFSPVFEFADHATARMVAEMSLGALFDDANFEVPDMRASATPPQTISKAAAQAAEETERAQSTTAESAETLADAAPDAVPDSSSRRDFLRGRWHADTL